MTHALFAVSFQLFLYLAFGADLLIGALLASGFYIGREHSQAEYRAIEQFYEGKRANAPLWVGLESRAWTRKGLIDCLAPSAAVFLFYFLVGG